MPPLCLFRTLIVQTMSFHFKSFLEGLYYVYNRRELVNPDPLLFLYDYDHVCDREIVGLIASCLAYGRVTQIMSSVKKILTPLGKAPSALLLQDLRSIKGLYKHFKHRFTTGEDIERLLTQTGEVLRVEGSLENLMAQCLKGHSFIKALDIFSLTLEPHKRGFSLLTAPKDGSACKRLLLYLKWMVRRDDVDPGGWQVLSPRELIIPTDTHLHHIGLKLGLTQRKQADLKTALEITQAFSKATPEDPVRYDFVLSRFGIRSALCVEELANLYKKD